MVESTHFVRFLFLISLLLWSSQAKNDLYNVFNVNRYGAVPNRKTDSSKAFLRAWYGACHSRGKTKILIPEGEYVLDSVLFIGPCKSSSIAFFLKGTLVPLDYTSNHEQWITFRYVSGLIVSGGGTLDGEGHKVWDLNDCARSGTCPTLPVSMRFEFVNNAKVHHIRSVNSRNAHFTLFACQNMDISNVRIRAPGDSPNTDGIKIGNSNGIRISRTIIGTGDDCIAIISGSWNIDISELYCGPGHGISVGSMGRYANIKDFVTGVTVRNSSFHGTTDGVRIKTWASSVVGLAANFTYRDIQMDNVGNPIVIDQQYCPYPPCDTTTPSHIQIKDITYSNIWGTSSSPIAVKLKCSQGYPCRNIVLRNINLSYNGRVASSSWCLNVIGNSYGHQKPPSCL